jgi:hypothetical protein
MTNMLQETIIAWHAMIIAWQTERAEILNEWRSGNIARVANGRLAQLNSNLEAARVYEVTP